MTKNQKNYILLITISILTIVIVWYAIKWHNAYKLEYNTQNYILNYVTEIKPEEFDSFINERRNVVVYFAKPADLVAYKFEKSFDDEIVKYSLGDEMVYMNVSSFTDEAYKTMVNQYNSPTLNSKVETSPAIGLFQDAKMVAFLSNGALTKEKVMELLEEYGIIHRI